MTVRGPEPRDAASSHFPLHESLARCGRREVMWSRSVSAYVPSGRGRHVRYPYSTALSSIPSEIELEPSGALMYFPQCIKIGNPRQGLKSHELVRWLPGLPRTSAETSTVKPNYRFSSVGRCLIRPPTSALPEPQIRMCICSNPMYNL